MRRHTLIYLLSAMLVLLAGCDVWDGPTRTVLYYAVKSNLGSDIERNIRDMESVATKRNTKGDLLVFTSDAKGNAVLYRIVPGRNGGKNRQEVASFTGRSGVDTRTLSDVIATAIDRFPADSYGLVFSSHGTSWLPEDVKNMQRVFGEENGVWMDICEMAEAIPDNTFEFIMFDACSMGSIECAYEFRNDCRHYISSPSEILTTGFPYSRILPELFNPEVNYGLVAATFNDYYKNNAYPYADISVVDCGHLGALADVVARSLTGGAGDTALYAVSTDSLQMLSSLSGSPTDLYDFEETYLRMAIDDAAREEFSSCVRRAVPVALHTGQHYCGRNGLVVPIERFCGLSVYPMRENLTRLNIEYRKFGWYKAAIAPQ